MKTTQIPPSGVTDTNCVSRCENLRRTPDNSLAPVGTPAPVAAQGWKPYHLYRHTDGTSSRFLINGMNLRIINGSHVDDFTLRDEPISVLTTPDGILFMHTDGSSMLHCSPASDDPAGGWAWELSDVEDLCSPIALVGRTVGDYKYVHTDRFDLRDSYGRSDTKLTDRDASAFSSMIREAYERLDAMCTADYCFLQPMIGYYRMLDAKGRLLYQSAPTLLGPSAGLNLTHFISTPIIMDYDENDPSFSSIKGINSVSLAAEPYRVVLRFISNPEESPLWRQAASIEIYLSPQIHPVDFSDDFEYRIEQASGPRPLFSFFLPGASSGFTPNHDRYAREVKMLLQHLDKACEPVARISAREMDCLTIGAYYLPVIVSDHSVKQDIKRCSSIIGSPVATDLNSAEEALLEQCRMPHSFSASAVGSGGSTVVWGNITPLPFSGYRVSEMMRDANPGLATDVAVTDIGGGRRRVVRSDSATGLAPVTLSPLLCYPLRAATSLTIMAETPDVGIRRREFPLESIPGCDFAFYLEPTLSPIPLDEWEEIPVIALPAERHDDSSMPGAVITADVLSPLQPKGCALASSAPIAEVMPATRDVSGWNFAHLRFYLLGAEGTMSLSVNPDNKPGRPVLLDSRPYAGSAFYGPDGTYIVAGDDLVHLVGGKAVTRIRGVSAAGYCRTFDEFWVIPSDRASPLRIYTSSLSEYYTRTSISAKALYTVGGTLYLLTDTDTLLDTSRELSIPVNVAWSKRFSLDVSRPFAATITSMMHAAEASGSISLSADFGPPEAARSLLSLNLDGAIDAPLSARFLSPPRPYYTYSFDMRVSPDFRFNSLFLR